MIGPLLKLGASQLGLGRVPEKIQKAVGFVPAKVNKALEAGFAKAVGRLKGLAGIPTAAEKLYAGLVGTPEQFPYNGIDYKVFAAADRGGPGGASRVQVKVVTTGTTPTLVVVLEANQLKAGGLDTLRVQLEGFVKKVQDDLAAKDNKGKPKPNQQLAQTDAASAQTLLSQLAAGLKANGCAALNVGCFAAGTKLSTPAGLRAVESFAVGDDIHARDENDPLGEVRVRQVEAIFRRSAELLRLRLVNGAVVLTTSEHPFHTARKGWEQAANLKAGDRLTCADGTTVAVESVVETGEYAVVYNLRVAEDHTYFVGEEAWGPRSLGAQRI